MADTTHIIFGADSTLRFKLGDISLSNDLRIENPYNKIEQDGMGLLDFVSHFIWPVFLIVTLFIFKSAINSLLKNVGNRIRKFNGFGVSLELSELNEEVEKVEQELGDKGVRVPDIIDIKGQGFAGDPPTINLETTALSTIHEIEQQIRQLYIRNNPEAERVPLSVLKLSQDLVASKIIDNDLYSLFQKFWKFRSEFVHSSELRVTDKELLSFIDIGRRILNLLRTI